MTERQGIISGIQELIKIEAEVRTRVGTEPKPMTQPAKEKMASPKLEELLVWKNANASNIKYMGQLRR